MHKSAPDNRHETLAVQVRGIDRATRNEINRKFKSLAEFRQWRIETDVAIVKCFWAGDFG